jgi:chromate reductase, NAD(P)H dehydrogenase (quinone)
MRVLGICGSLRSDSLNARLLRAAAAELPPGVDLELCEGLGELPPFNEDQETSAPAAVLRLREAVERADVILVATPEYNASIPGVLKNAVDWASRPFPDNSLRRKPVAVIGASTGLFGAVWAQAELRKVLRAAGARPLEEELPVGSADDAFTDDGSLRDDELAESLHDIVAALLREARAPVEAVA